MRFPLAVVACVFPASVPALPIGADASSTVSSQTNERKDKSAPTRSTLTGCIDEKQDRGYVLVEDKTLQMIAVLRAEGFPQEGLAKYLGNKVTVQGRTTSDGGVTVMRVQRVAKIADGCAPVQ